jgi:glycosyltransferase involved in cell wall biosynthesis
VTWIVPTVEAGGIGPAVLGIAGAAATACDATLLETHGVPPRDRTENGLRRVALDMGGTQAPASIVLDWLKDNPQSVVFTNGVSHLHEIFTRIPDETLHVAVLHDAARRYRDAVKSYAQSLDGVVTVSDYVRALAQRDLRAAAFPGIVRRIHNGTSYPPAPSRLGPVGTLKLLFIGGSEQKGGSQLIHIAKSLRRRRIDFHLTVIGDQSAWLPRQFAQAKLEGQLSLLDRQAREELWRLYAAHDVLLMLSWGEAFGMVTIEAMGMGCVPVAYDAPTGEIVEHGLSGLLVRSDQEEIAAAIADLSPARLRLMSTEAIRRARTLFSAERAAREYVQLVDDLVRCADLIDRGRIPALGAAPGAPPPSYSPAGRLYHALPSVVRRHIRNALSAYPTGFRRLRERI